jgi:soluble lytic murein transglycosylase-like protein
VIREARYNVGMDAPAGNFLAQIETESRCDQGITAFDGGMGLGQFMPETAEWIQKKEKTLQDIAMQPAPYDPRWSIRALILYDRWLYQHTSCHDWYYAFRSYNGGIGRMNKEIQKAGTCEFAQVEAACSRQIIKMKSGQLDMCKVNCEYPVKISQAARKYQDVLAQ